MKNGVKHIQVAAYNSGCTVLQQQQNACPIENVYSNAKLELIQQATVYMYRYSEKI